MTEPTRKARETSNLRRGRKRGKLRQKKKKFRIKSRSGRSHWRKTTDRSFCIFYSPCLASDRFSVLASQVIRKSARARVWPNTRCIKEWRWLYITLAQNSTLSKQLNYTIFNWGVFFFFWQGSRHPDTSLPRRVRQKKKYLSETKMYMSNFSVEIILYLPIFACSKAYQPSLALSDKAGKMK